MIRNGSKIEVVLSTPTQMRDFFTRDGKDHAKPLNMNMGHYFSRILGQCIGAQSGPKWRTTRFHFDPHFAYSAAFQFRGVFAVEITKWLQDLRDSSQVVEKSSSSFSIDAAEACRVLPFKLIACACFGELLTDATFAELLKLNTTHERLMATTFFSPRTTSKLFGLLPFAETRAMSTYKKDWEMFNMRIIHTARKTGLYCPAERIYEAVDKVAISKAEYLQTIDEILFTNVDVTSTVLGFLLINLATNRDCQEELRAEILDCVDKCGSLSTIDRYGSYLTASNTLLEFTCIESTRLYPAAWFSFPEYSPNTKTIDGYRIPPKTPIVVDWKRLNTESPVWNPGPIPGSTEPNVTGSMFEPRRFKKLSQTQYRYSLLRFGIGPRKCLGKNFASVMMKLFLVLVLSEYSLELQEEEGERSEAVELREDKFTITPKQIVRFVSIK